VAMITWLRPLQQASDAFRQNASDGFQECIKKDILVMKYIIPRGPQHGQVRTLHTTTCSVHEVLQK
ncbi:MAG: hypothetical protein DRM97_08270, partial [Thermoprotei archaeon]